MRRTVAAACAAAMAMAVVLAGCGGGTSAPPANGAARVVPADALAYVSVSLDASRAAVQQASSTLTPIPGYAAVRAGMQTRLTQVTGTNFRTAVRPWLGSEAAVAFVPDGTSASEMIVLAVKQRALAAKFVATTTAPAARLVDGYVVIGEPALVAAAGRGPSLASTSGFRAAQSAEPLDRVLDAYASGRGVSELLGGHAGLEGVLANVLSAEHPGSVAAALAPTGDGLRIWLRLATPGHRTATRFRPALGGALPAGTSGLVDMPSLTASGPGLLGALASGAGTSQASGLLARLALALKDQGVALAPLEALFSGESAIFELDGSVGLIAQTTDASAARLELGRVGQALAQLFAPQASSGVEPVVSTRLIGTVPVTVYQQGVGSQLAYAVFDGHVVVTTSVTTLGAIIDRKRTLSASSLYRSVLAGSGPSAGPVMFGAIRRLVRPGAAAGLLGQLGLAGVVPTLARISAAGLTTADGNGETTAELYFTIS